MTLKDKEFKIINHKSELTVGGNLIDLGETERVFYRKEDVAQAVQELKNEIKKFGNDELKRMNGDIKFLFLERLDKIIDAKFGDLK